MEKQTYSMQFEGASGPVDENIVASPKRLCIFVALYVIEDKDTKNRT